MLFEHGAELVYVNECFASLRLGSRQAATHGVPELHGRQEVGRGFGVLRLQEAYHLRVSGGVLDAMIQKLGRVKEKEKYSDCVGN